MKSVEMREMSTEDLQRRLYEWRENLTKMRCENTIGSVTDHSQFRKTKKDIARAHTVLTEWKLGVKSQ